MVFGAIKALHKRRAANIDPCNRTLHAILLDQIVFRVYKFDTVTSHLFSNWHQFIGAP